MADVETLTAHSMTIAGETVPTGTTFEVTNPSTGAPFAVVSRIAPVYTLGLSLSESAWACHGRGV